MTDNKVRTYRATVDGQTITVATRNQMIKHVDYGNERGWDVQFRFVKGSVIVQTPRGEAEMEELIDPADGPGV